MKILALELADKIIYGIIDQDNKYKEFSIDQDNNIEFQFKYKKSDYKDLSHFRGVIGKFNAYIIFMNPTESINELDFKELKKIFNKRYK